MSFDTVSKEELAKAYKVSIPFEQGDVFRPNKLKQIFFTFLVSIPFEQGDVFRPVTGKFSGTLEVSQSLSSRAMSFDKPWQIR